MASPDDWFAQQGPPGGGADDWFAQQGAPAGGPPTSTTPGAPIPGGGPGGAGGSGNPTDRNYVRAQLANWYASQGLTPTGPGTGPTDIEYYVDKILETGGWTNQTPKGEQNIDYWTKRIPRDLAEARGGGGGAGGYGTLSGGSNPLTQIAAQALETSPGFQFRLNEGLKGVERGAAAKGTLLTGGTLKGLTRYAQDYASNEYANQYARLFGEQGARYNQLFGLAGLGANAAAGTGAANSAYGNAGSGLMTDIGNAQAAGTVGSANAWQQPISGATNLAQMYYLSRLMQPGAAGGGGNYSTYAPGGPDFVGPMRP